MRVQLFNPSVWHYCGFHFRMMPPLSLPILAAVLNQAGHEAEVVDLEALHKSPADLEHAFRQQQEYWPDVIGMTGLTITAQGLRESIQALRNAGYDRRIVVGGIYATTNADEVLSWGADLVIKGECEGNLVRLLETGATGLREGEPMPINELPMPDWDHHEPEISTYSGNMAILRPNTGISMWTRGCPYNCIFCSNLIFGGQPTRCRPPANIGAEMADLKARGCRHVYVYDDELVGTKLPPRWMHDIADRIEPLRLTWVTQGRCSKRYITAELLQDMKRAGCRAVFWGIESFSQRVLDTVKKHLDVDDIWYTLRLAKEAGIENGVFTMIGNYGETPDDLEVTAEALGRAYREGLVDYRQTTACTPMPGTELARMAQTEGWYVDPPHGGRSMMYEYNATPWLSVAEINAWMRRFDEVCPVVIPP